MFQRNALLAAVAATTLVASPASAGNYDRGFGLGQQQMNGGGGGGNSWDNYSNQNFNRTSFRDSLARAVDSMMGYFKDGKTSLGEVDYNSPGYGIGHSSVGNSGSGGTAGGSGGSVGSGSGGTAGS